MIAAVSITSGPADLDGSYQHSSAKDRRVFRRMTAKRACNPYVVAARRPTPRLRVLGRVRPRHIAPELIDQLMEGRALPELANGETGCPLDPLGQAPR